LIFQEAKAKAKAKVTERKGEGAKMRKGRKGEGADEQVRRSSGSSFFSKSQSVGNPVTKKKQQLIKY